MSSETVAAIKEGLGSLLGRFKLQRIRDAQWGNWTEVVFANQTTGLAVTVDWAEFRPFFRIFDVQSGPLPRGPLFYEPDCTPVLFDVDDLLVVRHVSPSPVGKMFANQEHEAITRLVGEYARVLEDNAADVLGGDLTVFAELEKLIQARTLAHRDNSR